MNHRFVRRETQGVTFFSSALLTAPHGFSTRLGGVSREDALAALNLGYDRGEEHEAVEENYRRFLASFGATAALTAGRVVRAHQIHSDIVRIAQGAGPYDPCDGFVTAEAGLVLTVRVADCMPILLEDPAAGVVAALHAGWRGTVADIVGAGVAAMVSLGATPSRIRAALGPSIRSCCYEVGEDFYMAVEKALGKVFADTFVTAADGGKRHADIAGMNRTLLRTAGIKEEHIDLCPLCTACHGELFYSHRRQGTRRGSLAAAILCPER